MVPEDGPPYTITETVENTCGGGEKVGRHITGEMTVPLYLTDAAPSSMLNRDAPADPDSAVSQNGTAQVPFTIIVPCSVLAAGVPAPLLQVGHGLFGSHTDIRWDPYTPVAEAAGMVMFATSWRGMSSDDYNAVTLMMAQDPSDFDIIPDGLTQGHLEAQLMARLMQGAMVGDAALSLNDEPLIDPETISAVADAVRAGHAIATAATPLHGDATVRSRVKVVVRSDQAALYFSRSAIPIDGPWLLHLGVYGFQPDVLQALAALPQSTLERAESLEQLRWLEAGYSMHVAQVQHARPAVDTPEDLEHMRTLWKPL